MRPTGHQKTLLDGGKLPVAELARIAMREGVRPRAAYQSHKWFARRLAITARSLLVAGAITPESDFWREFYRGDTWVGKTVLDPFMGGGVMLLEAARLGADVKGVDVEPVAAVIAKFQTTLRDLVGLEVALETLTAEVGRKMEKHYQTEDGGLLLHSFWVQTLACGSCDLEFDAHPSLRFAWDERRGKQWVACRQCSRVIEAEFGAQLVECLCGATTIVASGPVTAGEACCPSCGHRERLIAHARRTGMPPKFRLFGVETLENDDRRIPTQKRVIRTASDFDRRVYQSAEQDLLKLLRRSPRALPAGRIPSRGRSDDRLLDYGYRDYGQLFNARQRLHLALLGRAIGRLSGPAREAMAIAFSDHLTTNNMMCGYAGGWRRLTPLFSIRAYRHIGRPIEINPWLTNNGRGTFPNAVRSIIRASQALKHPTEPRCDGAVQAVTDAEPGAAEIVCGDARNLDHIGDRSVDLVLTDPPYFDYISYSELGHFFTPWLSRFGLVDGRHVKGFPLAQLASIARSADAERRFAQRLGAAFKEIRRVCRDDGRVAFTYQNRDGRGWSAIANAMALAGVIPIQTFPLFGDSSAGLHKHAASISWDSVVVCRVGDPVRRLRVSLEDREAGRRAALKWRIELAAKGLEVTSGDMTNISYACEIVAAFTRRVTATRTPVRQGSSEAA
jgi:adenine-specific DNA methylase